MLERESAVAYSSDIDRHTPSLSLGVHEALSYRPLSL